MPRQSKQKPEQEANPNTPAPADMNARLAKPNEMKFLLENRREDLDALLAETGISVDRFIGTVIHTLAATPNVMVFPKGELLLAVLEAAKMGLEPTGAYGGGYLVPHKGHPVFWVDWRGFIKMGMRSGQLRKADPFIVFENDEFDYVLGDEQYIHHRPLVGTLEQRGDPRFAYAILELMNGAKVREVMSWDEVMAIMARAPAGAKGPWGSDPLEMGRKTVIRRVFKRVPVAITPQLAYALEREDAEWEEERIRVDPGQSGRSTQRGRRGVLLDRALGTGATPEGNGTSTAAESGEEPSDQEAAEKAKATDPEEGLPE